MKIILANRDEQGHLGGDAIQLRGYQKALQALGHSAEYTHGQLYADPNEYRYYDEMWGLHCNFDWAYNAFLKAKQAGIGFRLFAIFYQNVYVGINKDNIRDMVDYAKAIYCLSSQEKQEMIDELSLSPHTHEKIYVIPNGVDSSVFNLIGATSPSPTNYVISTGRFAGEKGFDRIVRACNSINVPVVIIGANWDNQYKEQVRAIWDDAWIFDQMDQAHVAMYLRAANVYVCAAENERNNLALIEGIACGAKPISSPGNRGNEFFPQITIVDPKDEQVLAEAIKTAYSAESFQRPAYSIPDWKQVVEMIFECDE